MTHPVLTSGRTAVVTGAANGIGLASSRRFAALGMNVVMADMAVDELEAARAEVAMAAEVGPDAVIARATDVADPDQIAALRDAAIDAFGAVSLVMCNAVARVGGGIHGDERDWRRAMDVNFWGVVDCVRAFLPGMIASGAPGLVITAGSKQGITNPPGNTAYNITKSALKSYTEALEHELRNTEDCQITAHLLIPGWTRAGEREQKMGAWTPDQVVDFMADALERGSFYISCPDGETTPAMDRKRTLWAAGDITEDRPALSRWHPDYATAFESYEP